MTKPRIGVQLRRLLNRAIRYSKNPARRAAFRQSRADLPPVVVPAPPKPDPVTTWPAIRAARTQSEQGPQFAVGMCLAKVHDCYGIGALFPSAAAAWKGAKVKHPETDPAKFPRGYPLFWTGGSRGFGHVAIAAGDGMCWSTDIKRPGFFDKCAITDIHDKWGLTLVGWTEDLNGRPVVASVTK